MNVSKIVSAGEWIDPDDAPELTDEMVEMAQYSVGGRVIRPATGVLTKDGMKRVPPYVIPIPGRPPLGAEAKKQVTLRLDADLLAFFRADGAGWQTRLNAMLRKAAGI
jgi:uncharacterized protein (DUF4415 family)